MSDKENTKDDDTDDGNDSMLDISHPVLVPIPDEINDVCTPAALEIIDSKQTCEAICAKAECCNFPERLPQSCLADNHLECLQYHKLCAYLDDNTPSIAQDIEIPVAPANLLDICSGDSTASPGGLAQCTDICEPAKCCYEITTSNCRDDENCDGYAGCFNLRVGAIEDQTIEMAVTAACTVEGVQTVQGRAKCSSLCLQQRCCIHGAETCAHKSQAICDQYFACEHLYHNNDVMTPVTTGHAQIDLPPANSGTSLDFLRVFVFVLLFHSSYDSYRILLLATISLKKEGNGTYFCLPPFFPLHYF